ASRRHLRFVQSSALGAEPTSQGQPRCSRRAEPVLCVDCARFQRPATGGRLRGGECHTARTTSTRRNAPWVRGRYRFQASTLFRTHFSRYGNMQCSVELGIARQELQPRAQHASIGVPRLECGLANPNKSKVEPTLSPWWSVRAWFPRL